ncbi:ABC-2 family transporter protein [Patescibacteria group bacterium]|nr:ABC-2 family transporter protein [Patescibacteria group bacterium]
MKFSTYKDSLGFGLLQVANYRGEVWFSIIGKALSIFGIVLLWSIIGKESSGVGSFWDLAPYFLIANGVSGLVDAESTRFSRILNDEIKLGTLSNHLLRPIHPVLFLYVSFLGSRGVVMVMSILLLLSGLLLLPAISFVGIILFLFCLLFAFVIALAINLLIGSITFWTTEADHLQNVASHVVRIFSGVMIPVSLFPERLKMFTLLSPFPAMGFLPATLIKNPVWGLDIYISFLSSVFWVAVFLPFSLLIWKIGLRRYEAVGI